MNKPVVLWDKDSTLANTYHRQYMIPLIRERKATWNDYHSACLDDKPIDGTVTLMRLLEPFYHNIVVSGASKSAEPLIRKWAEMYNVPITDMILRPDKDHRLNADFKVGVIQSMQEAGINPVLFVEDWPVVAEQIFRVTGVPVLVINPCYPEDSPHNNSNVTLPI
jgi:hypothetical protein